MSSRRSADAYAIADRMHSAAIHVLRRVRRVDDASGLTAARLSALSVVVFGGPLPLGDLARAEQVSAPTMSKLVRGLERDGLVTREANERDGRSVLVRPTAKGRRTLVQGRERRISELVRLFESLSPEDLARLDAAAEIVEDVLGPRPSAQSAYAGDTAERRWSGLRDDSTGSGGTSG